jgi:hypothetical protein
MGMIVRSWLVASVCSASIALAGPNGSKLSERDEQIVTDLYAFDESSIAAGKLAHGAYGDAVIQAHTRIEARLLAFSSYHGLDPRPVDPSTTKPLIVAQLAAAHVQELLEIDAELTLVSNAELATILRTYRPTLQALADAGRRPTN